MNQTLEGLARALFRSWFVDFDPVVAKAAGRRPLGMNAATAKLFPDSFADSPLGPIPKGWRWGKLGEIAQNLRRGVSANELREEHHYIALEHVPRCSIALDQWASADGVMSQKFQFGRGEILFGKLRPYFHKVGVAPVDGICSTDILVIAPRSPTYFGLTLAYASSEEIIQYADGGSTGTRMPRTSWDHLSSFEIVIPPEPVAASFTRLARDFADRIIANIHVSRSLADLRDALLPRLLSGELRVKQAKRIVAEADV
jgi:type I restriction enzyme S subunit